jgi:hypothetical protein
MVLRRMFCGLLLGAAAALPLSHARAQEDEKQRCERLEREERDITEQLDHANLDREQREKLERLRAQLHEERERTCPH